MTNNAGPLSDEIRLFIIEWLAAYETPTAVAEAVEKEFGRKVSRQSVEAYDPGKVKGSNLSDRYREHFQKAREKFRAVAGTFALEFAVALLLALGLSRAATCASVSTSPSSWPLLASSAFSRL